MILLSMELCGLIEWSRSEHGIHKLMYIVYTTKWAMRTWSPGDWGNTLPYWVVRETGGWRWWIDYWTGRLWTSGRCSVHVWGCEGLIYYYEVNSCNCTINERKCLNHTHYKCTPSTLWRACVAGISQTILRSKEEHYGSSTSSCLNCVCVCVCVCV